MSIRSGHYRTGPGGKKVWVAPHKVAASSTGTAAGVTAASVPAASIVAGLDPMTEPTARARVELMSPGEVREGDRIDAGEVTRIEQHVDGYLFEVEHGVVDDVLVGGYELLEVSRTEELEPPQTPAAAPAEKRHWLSYTESGAVCSCGREFSAYTTARKGGWNGRDAQRTTNIVKANARRHAQAANRKLQPEAAPE